MAHDSRRPGELSIRTRRAWFARHGQHVLTRPLFILICRTTRTQQQAAQTSPSIPAQPAPAPAQSAPNVATVDKAPQAPCATTPQAPPPPTKTRDAGGGAALTAAATGSDARRPVEPDGAGGRVLGCAHEEGFYCAVCDCVVDSMRSVFNGFQRLGLCLPPMLCRALAPARICRTRSHPSSTMLEPLSRQGVL